MIGRCLPSLLTASDPMPPPQHDTFELYLDDDRYAVPTLKLIEATDTLEALALARGLIRESPHHRGAELCLRGRRLAGLGSYAARESSQG